LTLPIAIILAAGQGLRLAPLTHDRPKALVEIHGSTLLERSVEALAAAGFRRATVVTGYRADLIVESLLGNQWQIEVTARFNPAFATANNIVSFLAVADLLADGFCLLNSDIVFDPAILADVADARHAAGAWLVVDADEELGAEEMKVELDEDGVIRRINKALPPETSAGEYIGIARFDGPSAATALDGARRIVDEGGTNLYYEDAFARIAQYLTMRPIPTRGRVWTEVDDLVDRDRAEGIAAELDARKAP
jgi:choline kinase